MLLRLFHAAILPPFETMLNCKLFQKGHLSILYCFLSHHCVCAYYGVGRPHVVSSVFWVTSSVKDVLMVLGTSTDQADGTCGRYSEEEEDDFIVIVLLCKTMKL